MSPHSVVTLKIVIKSRMTVIGVIGLLWDRPKNFGHCMGKRILTRSSEIRNGDKSLGSPFLSYSCRETRLISHLSSTNPSSFNSRWTSARMCQRCGRLFTCGAESVRVLTWIERNASPRTAIKSLPVSLIGGAACTPNCSSRN
jgi:hypothetical protein